jgi:cytochrome b
MSDNSKEMEAGRIARPATILVWDIFVRIFHWSLVAAMAYELIARAGTQIHEFLGYAILAAIALRIIWGFFGSKYARFSDFVKSPIRTFKYLADIARGHPKRNLGHNPAGAAMVIALLLMVSATAVSGWAMTTDALWGTEWIEEAHELSADVTIALIFAHVLGVIFASWQHKENLIAAMITGRKKIHMPE